MRFILRNNYWIGKQYILGLLLELKKEYQIQNKMLKKPFKVTEICQKIIKLIFTFFFSKTIDKKYPHENIVSL